MVKGDSLQCREMSAQLTEGTGDRWEMLSPLRRGVRGEAEPLLKSSVTSEAMSHGCLTSIPLGLTDEIIIDIYLQK